MPPRSDDESAPVEPQPQPSPPPARSTEEGTGASAEPGTRTGAVPLPGHFGPGRHVATPGDPAPAVEAHVAGEGDDVPLPPGATAAAAARAATVGRTGGTPASAAATPGGDVPGLAVPGVGGYDPLRAGWFEPVGEPPDQGAAPAPDDTGEPGEADGADGADEPTRTRLLRRLLGDDRLALDATRRARVLGWVWPLAVTVLGGLLRFWDLARPHVLVFDETYYVKQAYSLLARGFEAQWGDDPNPAFEAGDTSGLGHVAEYVVHPPVGKWMIALGMQVGGGVESAFAWRLSVAVCGTLAILMIARIARRLFASTALGTVAGLLLAVDGEAIVHSRISLLDPFLMFFVLGAFGALLIDRDQARRRLADRAAVMIDAGRPLGLGPRLGWRWWRLAAAVLLGLAIGTKWSGIYFLAVFGLMSVLWDVTARRAVGVRFWAWAGVWRDGVVAGVSMVLIAASVYLASWWSWFASSDGYLRQWAAQHPGEGVQWLPPALRSLWKFHTDMWHFHTTLTAEHAYAAHPLGWIVQWRPTSYYYPTEVSGLTGQQAIDACGATSCSQAITSMGNPVIWWAGAAAVLVAVVWLVWFRDWRAGAVLSGIVAGWLPWFLYAERTIFTFYSIAFTPWVVLTLTYVLGLVIGPRTPDNRSRRTAIAWVTAFLVLVVLVSAFFYPIWTAWVVPYDFWHSHMWLPSWV